MPPPGSATGVDTLKGILCGVQRVPSLLMFSPECALGDLNLQDYEVIPFEPLHDLKGYLGSVLRKLPPVIQSGALKKKESMYLETVWKKAHLYGSDLREALIEVAYLFISSPETTDDTTAVRKYVMCLVQISKILYSLDMSRSPKQCLQFYNCAFTVHDSTWSCLVLPWLHSTFVLYCSMVHSGMKLFVAALSIQKMKNDFSSLLQMLPNAQTGSQMC